MHEKKPIRRQQQFPPFLLWHKSGLSRTAPFHPKLPLVTGRFWPRLCKNVFQCGRHSKPDWKSRFHGKSTSADVPINSRFNVETHTSILATRFFTLWTGSSPSRRESSGMLNYGHVASIRIRSLPSENQARLMPSGGKVLAQRAESILAPSRPRGRSPHRAIQEPYHDRGRSFARIGRGHRDARSIGRAKIIVGRACEPCGGG